MNFEDHFSELAETYSKYRPSYPSELFEYLSSVCKDHRQAWDLDQVAGFLNSWSGTKFYLQKTGRHPLNEIWHDLNKEWGDEKIKRKIHWPMHMIVGKTAD